MSTLLNCPFCGGEAYIRDDQDHSTAVYFGCSTVGCLGNYQWAETCEEAVASWNRRADLPPTDAECLRNEDVRALVEAVKQRCCDRCLDGDVEAALAALEQEASE